MKVYADAFRNDGSKIAVSGSDRKIKKAEEKNEAHTDKRGEAWFIINVAREVKRLKVAFANQVLHCVAFQ